MHNMQPGRRCSSPGCATSPLARTCYYSQDGSRFMIDTRRRSALWNSLRTREELGTTGRMCAWTLLTISGNPFSASSLKNLISNSLLPQYLQFYITKRFLHFLTVLHLFTLHSLLKCCNLKLTLFIYFVFGFIFRQGLYYNYSINYIRSYIKNSNKTYYIL